MRIMSSNNELSKHIKDYAQDLLNQGLLDKNWLELAISGRDGKKSGQGSEYMQEDAVLKSLLGYLQNVNRQAEHIMDGVSSSPPMW